MDEKAMNILAAARAEIELIGFHAQQAAEKYLKALLSHRRVVFGRTHDLQTLLDLLKSAGESIPTEVEEICELFPYAVEFRYEDISVPPNSGPDQNWMTSQVQAVHVRVEKIIHTGQTREAGEPDI
jgi:HEPN domain-containing protein